MTAKKTLQGVVVSPSRNKTVVVRVTVQKRHPRYHKKYTTASRYKVHDEQGNFAIGDIVEIEESRPISRTKRWKLVQR